MRRLDIVVVRDAGDAVTVEVKGLAKKYDWPASSPATDYPDREVEQFERCYRTRINDSRSAIQAEGERVEDVGK